MRFPRIARWRRDKPAVEADSLESALDLMRDSGGQTRIWGYESRLE